MVLLHGVVQNSVCFKTYYKNVDFQVKTKNLIIWNTEKNLINEVVKDITYTHSLYKYFETGLNTTKPGVFLQ